MTIIKKRHKPFYKQFLIIRKNIQNRVKLFKFKKKKWIKLQQYARSQLRFFKRYKIKDHYTLKTTKYASKGNSFQKNYKKTLLERKTFNIFYGGLKKKYLKKQIKNILNNKKKKSISFQTFHHQVTEFFESRLDTVLYRSKFSLSMKSARQLIRHGHILVNGMIVRTNSYILKTDDLIEVALNTKSRSLIKKSIDRSNLWPIPPKHLIINYNTCQIIFMYNKNLNLLPTFDHYLNINSIISSINNY